MFTYKKYVEIIIDILSKGYKIQDFSQPYSLCGNLYLRHDVDCDPVKALQLANCEKENNFFSTYFFQVDSDFYNLLSKENQKILHLISNMGHHIGLHISPDHSKDSKELSLYIKKTYVYIKNLGLPCDPIFSFHRPGSFAGWEKITIPDFINVYSDNYFSNITYVSDSNRRRFWETSLLDLHKYKEPRSIQLLTHPIWWNEEELSSLEISVLLKNRSFYHLQKSLKENIKLYKKIYQDFDDMERN
ncbi:MAG: hypothetical protein PHS04_19120 [Tissierellia bacterium]|jgi:hypothetical protein|nr:hypothetical protein [Tissierellia bacterium]